MATIQTTQLEERETGDIKQLRDHDIAEGPVSTNSADATSLKSVPLTLEDGSIIKVRFDSLVTAIGQALGASEDSTVTKVLGLNGTVPKGIGMANLASVLGVHIGSTNNWSNYMASIPDGKPFIVTAYNGSTTHYLKIGYKKDANNIVYHQMSYIDGYNYIEGLKNGNDFSGQLGDVVHFGVTDCNACAVGWNQGYRMEHSPSDINTQYSLYIEHIRISNTTILQRAYQTVGGVWTRGYQDGAWTSWTRA